jgi:hypothetical protein
LYLSENGCGERAGPDLGLRPTRDGEGDETEGYILSETGQNPAALANANLSSDLEKASLDSVYASLSTSPKGLTSADAKQRIDQYGRNELVEEEISNLQKFLRWRCQSKLA